MKNISSCKKYILVVAGKCFKLFNKTGLSLITERPMDDVLAYYLHDSFLFVSHRSGCLEALNLPELAPSLIADLPKSPVRALYARENLLCIGMDNGTIRTYLFNETALRVQKEYKHNGPIDSIGSDGITILVTDYCQRITEYPANRSYDFKNPRIYCGHYLICVEGARIYLKTNKVFGLFHQAEQPIDDLFLSEKGGFIFLRSGSHIICIDSETGEAKGEYIAGESVVANEALVSYSDGQFEVIDLFFHDKEMSDVKFRNVNIKEKKRDGEEYDKRHMYVQDGNSRSIGKRRDGREEAQRAAARDTAMPVEQGGLSDSRQYGRDGECRGCGKDDGEFTDYRGCSRNAGYRKHDKSAEHKYGTMRGHSNLEYKKPRTAEEDAITFDDHAGPASGCPSSTQENAGNTTYLKSCIAKNSSSYKHRDATLLHFSSEGYMLSIETPISSHVSIKYHDNALEPLEFKDTNKCAIGCFYGREFAISNGIVVNYSDKWSKEMRCRMLGINECGIFVFGDILAILDSTGEILEEVYLVDYYTFCTSAYKIAIFSRTHVTIIEYDNNGHGGGECQKPRRSNSMIIPVEGVDFCSFHEDKLHVRIRGMLFRLEGCVFVKQCNVQGHPLTIYDGFVLTLSEPPTLLPRPIISYNEINPRRMAQQEVLPDVARGKCVKFNILDQ